MPRLLVPRRPQILTDRRVASALGLGFSSGLPLLLVYVTQSAWLSEAGIPIATIGLLSELTLAYKLKFLWAPLLDRHDAPLLGRWLGRRRGWIVAAQILVALALCGVATGDPGRRLWWTVLFSLTLGFAGATQDVTIDGWRIAVAPENKAVMSSWMEIGWRLGTFAAGAGALFLSDRIGWRGAYLCMAALMLPGVATALLAPEPPRREAPPSATGYLGTIWEPVRDLLARLGPLAPAILVVVAGFRMPGYVSTAMAVPLFKHLHYSNTDIATVTKVFGVWVALAATFFGGWLVPRAGMMASLVIGTVAGSASHLALAWLAHRGGARAGGGEFWVFAGAVSIDAFAYAFASIVLITYMSTLCTSALAASQYALLTSLVALPGSILAALSGFAVARLGFTGFFVVTSLLGIPVALLCWWLFHAQGQTERRATA